MTQSNETDTTIQTSISLVKWLNSTVCDKAMCLMLVISSKWGFEIQQIWTGEINNLMIFSISCQHYYCPSFEQLCLFWTCTPALLLLKISILINFNFNIISNMTLWDHNTINRTLTGPLHFDSMQYLKL